MNRKIKKLKKINIYADGADEKTILEMNKNKLITGFTTNPTLMRKSGVRDYEKFSKKILNKVKKKPISFEVFSDDLNEMKEQALKISSWGQNIFVKIPIMNTQKKYTYKLIKQLTDLNIKLNITAIMTEVQAIKAIESIQNNTETIISIFAGRIADTQRDPLPILNNIIKFKNTNKLNNVKILWASPREILNLQQAREIGCDIITLTDTLIDKIKYTNYNLNKFSLDTVKMFYLDAKKSKFKI